METHEFSSSNLESGRYDSDTRDLFVTFTSGAEYVYHSVPESTWRGLCGASSAGTYFSQNIRNVYPYERIN